MKKVLLIHMPFGALERPALGISLLKARLAQFDIPCDIRYLNLDFAEYVGEEDYVWVCSEIPHVAFAGDWLFTPTLYGDRPTLDDEYTRRVLERTWRLDRAAIQRLLRLRAFVADFMDRCIAQVPWQDYAVVGFTSTFEQNIASLSLAKQIKARHPGIAIAFGGANWEGDMGLELHRRFPFVDFACSGEADNSFPALVQAVRAGQSSNAERLNAIRGIVFRHQGHSIFTGQADLVRDMDSLPIPDFSDYFEEFERSTAVCATIPVLLLETSRGCWWGAKSHCLFCGLNGDTMTFRSKSQERALAEMDYLVDRWDNTFVEFVDNILDMSYFKHFMPELARSDRNLGLFYEVKANLKRHHVEMLAQAGVQRIQPGVESLNNHVLKLMRKGTTALQNVQLLKWCKQYGVHADWNLLYGFPGETRKDYEDTLRLLPAIRFLNPPTSCGSVRLDRFSPYFVNPGLFGFTNVRPMEAYRYIYPFDAESVARIAVFFDYDYVPSVDPSGFADDVIAYAEDWKRRPESGMLSAVQRGDGALALLDSRSDAASSEIILFGLEKAAYEFCEGTRSAAQIASHLRERIPTEPFDEDSLRAFLDSLVANHLMAKDGFNYLSLAIPVPPALAEAGPAKALAAE